MTLEGAVKRYDASRKSGPLPERTRSLQDVSLRLAILAAELNSVVREPAPRSAPSEMGSDLLAKAKAIYDSRRRRAEFFNDQYFGEPAWDMLLDLFISFQAGREVDVTSISIASAAPPTTALRWLGILEAAGMVLRRDSGNDKRRTYIELSDQGLIAMKSYLSAVHMF